MDSSEAPRIPSAHASGFPATGHGDLHAAAQGRAECATPPRSGHGRPEVRPPGRPAGGFTHRLGILPHGAGPAAAGSQSPALQAGRLHATLPRSGHGRPEGRPLGRPASGFTHRLGILPHGAGPAAAGSQSPALQAGHLHTTLPRSGHGRPEVRPLGRPANPWRSPRRPKAVGAMDGPTAVNSEVIPHADAGTVLVVEHELILRVGSVEILEPDPQELFAPRSAPGPARLHDHVATPVEFLS